MHVKTLVAVPVKTKVRSGRLKEGEGSSWARLRELEGTSCPSNVKGINLNTQKSRPNNLFKKY